MQSFFTFEHHDIGGMPYCTPFDMDTEKLIERMKAGDAEALRMVYETFVPAMRKVCFGITHADDDTVNDLVQEAFIRAYYSIGQLRDGAKFGEWVAAITRNVSLKHLEQKQRMPFVPLSASAGEEVEADHGATPESALGEKELLELLERMPEGYARVFRMAVIEGYSHQEIAERLGINAHSSSSQLSRAKAMLRRMVGNRYAGLIALALASIPLGIYLLHFSKHDDKIASTGKEPRKKNVARRTIIKKRSVAPHIIHTTPLPSSSSKKHPAPTPADSLYVPTDSVPQPLIAQERTDSTLSDTIGTQLWKRDTYIAANDKHEERSKWQIVASSSLESALTQNVDKAFSGNAASNTDGPYQPTEPTDFTTWEAYYEHLRQTIHSNPTAEDKALLEIAKHNSGDIVEHEHHDKPITFRLSAAKLFGRRWGVETGMQYSLLRSDFTLGEGAYRIERLQKVHYLGVPLRVSYKWLDVKRFSAYTAAGATMHIPVYGKNNIRYITGADMPFTTTQHFTPPLQWSIGAGIGLQYRFAPAWSIYAEPSFDWHVPSGSAIRTTWSEHPVTFAVPLGIRFTW